MAGTKEKTWYTKAQLREMYDGWWATIISHLLEQQPERKKGALKKFAFKGEPLTKEQYNEMRVKRFTTSIGSAVSEAESLVEEMKGELEEWAENMPENFEEKKSEIEEASSVLDSALNSIQSADLHEFCETYSYYDTPYQYPIFRGRRNMSRPQRNAHAIGLLEAAKGALEEVMQECQERIDAIAEAEENPVTVEAAAESTEKFGGMFDDKTADELEEIRSSAESSMTELENAIGELEGVDFPRAR